MGRTTKIRKQTPKFKNVMFLVVAFFCIAAPLILNTHQRRPAVVLPSSPSSPTTTSSSSSSSTLTPLNILLQSALKTRSGNGWKIVDYSREEGNDHHGGENKNAPPPPPPHDFKCDWVVFRSTSGKEANMCVHPFDDIVSDSVRKNHRWQDCDVLPKLWHENTNANTSSTSSSSIYVEIGGNIGTCIMEMLLSTDAPIIAFEPNPKNIFVLTQTISRMEKSYQERIVIVPVALGDEKGSNKMYAASNNMGNSVVGKVIKDFHKQQFSQNDVFDIHVERLDDILEPAGPDIGLVKMDAQGYECRIVQGFGNKIAAKMKHIHFEIAPKWQKQQGCFDLCQRLRDYGFEIWKGGNIVEQGEPGGRIFDVDAIKPRSKK